MSTSEGIVVTRRTLAAASVAMCSFASAVGWWVGMSQGAPVSSLPAPLAATAVIRKEREQAVHVETASRPRQDEKATTRPRVARHAPAVAVEEPVVEEPGADLATIDDATNDESVRVELGGIVDAEAVDRDFRGQAQADIENAAGESGGSVELVSADCRTTLCRIELSAADRDALQAFMERLPARLSWSTETRATMTDLGTRVLGTLFVTREGVAMPVPASDDSR